MFDVQTIEQSNKEYSTGRTLAMGLASVVYCGVVLAVTVIYITFVLNAFPANAYFSRGVMTLAGVLIGLSMIAFPIALHKWTVEKTHRLVTIGLYFGEMLLIAVNTFVSFSALLAKNTGYAAPAWAVLYKPFSVVASLYTLAAWGIIFLLDPAHKRKAKQLQNEEKFHQKIEDKMNEFLDSVEGEDRIMEIAEKRAAERFSASRFNSGPKHFGSRNKTTEALPQNNTPALPGMNVFFMPFLTVEAFKVDDFVQTLYFLPALWTSPIILRNCAFYNIRLCYFRHTRRSHARGLESGGFSYFLY